MSNDRDPFRPGGAGADRDDEVADAAEAAGDSAPPSGEQELRRLLQESVDGIEPAPGSLEALQAAVPARRRRRQRVAAATTVAVLAVGTPVTLQAASIGEADDRSTEATTEESAGGNGTDGDAEDGPGTYDTGGGGAGGGTTDGGAGELDGPSPQESTGAEEPDVAEDDPLAQAHPRCDRDQLGDVTTEIDDPVAGGLVYGSTQLTNVSTSACRIRGKDELTATPIGDESKPGQPASVTVVDRVEGDRATDLPLEEEWHDELLLKPGEAYEVAFAWVPRGTQEGCESPGSGDSGSGGSGGEEDENAASMEDGGGGGGSGGGNGGDGGDDEGSDGSEGADDGSGGDSGEESEGVVIRYTPAAGQPRADRFELESNCAGSLHRTGVLQVAPD